MENYLDNLNNLLQELVYSKTIIDSCCNEICLAIQRLKNRELLKENMKKAKEVQTVKLEEESVDLQMVEELIQKAQNVLIVRDEGEKKAKKSKANPARIKSADVSKTSRANPVAHKKGLSKPTSAKERVVLKPNQTSKKKHKVEKESATVDAATIERNLPEPFTFDFRSCYFEFVKLNRHCRSATNKMHSEKEKTTQEFMKSLFIGAKQEVKGPNFELFDELAGELMNDFLMIDEHRTSKDLEMMLSSLSQCNQLQSKIQEIENLKQNSNLLKEYLESYSNRPEVTLKNYRLIHWILCGTMPVLLQDDNIET